MIALATCGRISVRGGRREGPAARAGVNKIAFLLLGALGAVSSPLLSAPALSAREELSVALLRAEKDPNSEFMVSVWQAGEGLPVNVLDELEETPDGYLWVGTRQGLIRFDGLRFESFFRTPTGLRYGARVGPLEMDARGRLWLAPDQVGLVCLDAGSFTEVLTNGAVLRVRVECLCSDGTNGMLWVDADGGSGGSPRSTRIGATGGGQSLRNVALAA